MSTSDAAAQSRDARRRTRVESKLLAIQVRALVFWRAEVFGAFRGAEEIRGRLPAGVTRTGPPGSLATGARGYGRNCRWHQAGKRLGHDRAPSLRRRQTRVLRQLTMK